MRRLYTLLIYATMVLAVVTVWAMGYESQAQSELARAQQAAAAPQFSEELARIERAEAAEAAAAAHPAAAPSTRPTSPDRRHPEPQAEASNSEP